MKKPLRLRNRVPRRFSAAAAAVAVVCGVLGVQEGCVCERTLPPEAGSDFGDTASPAPDARACLKRARAILVGAGSEAGADLPPVAEGPGRRIMLTLWRGSRAPVVASGNGSSLREAVSNAADALAKQAGTAGSGEGRLEIDVPTALKGADIDDDVDVPQGAMGLEGVFAIRDDGKSGFVLPGEIVQRGLFKTNKLDHAAIARLLAERAGVPTSELAKMRAYRFRVDAFVESADRAVALPVLRGMVQRSGDVTVEELLAAVRRGADYLVHALNASGRYAYMVHPADDRADNSYGWLRHCGTTYALFEAYEEFGDPSYRDAGERALAYLVSHMSRDPSGEGMYVVDTDDEEQQKVGGAGLALMAFAKHAASTGSRKYLETMRALARFVLKQQYPDGHFRSNADVEQESGKRLKRELWYYPGEAILGLMRLYAIDPQPSYLAAARKGADWVVHVRDAYVSEDNLEHDHWMSYAFNELYRVAHDDGYLTHAYEIAHAIQKKQRGADHARAADLVGTFYEGQTTPASTRVEAYDADAVLSRFAGRPEAWLIGSAKTVARSILIQQFEPENDYWLRNAGRAEGGVRESPFINDIRIDYVQHAMSAWLHLARILRDPNYGKTGVPCQDPVRGTVQEETTSGK